MALDIDWWRAPLGHVISGRKVVVAGGPVAMWTPVVGMLHELGAADVMIVATEGTGAGPLPEGTTMAVVERADTGGDTMAAIRRSIALLADPPPDVVAALDAFDPDRAAVVFGSFLTETPWLAGRPLVAHRRPEWVALEDKTRLAPVLDAAKVARSPSAVVPVGDATRTWRDLDEGAGTVWAADATRGYHGGGSLTRWVTDDREAATVAAELGRHGLTVRIMPFLDGIACSIHGIVMPDGVVVVRPVELVTLRDGHALRYAGCATFWDPPAAVREEMRAAARRVGEELRRTVDFRGAFTIDGVATTDGFRPTELNPRFGAGLSTITRGLGDPPLNQLLDLVVAGHPLGVTAAELEATILADADAQRSGGTWLLHVATPETITGRGAVRDGGQWRWARDGEATDGTVVAGVEFARLTLRAARVPVGPSIGPTAAAFWRFYDEQTGAGTGSLVAPRDVSR